MLHKLHEKALLQEYIKLQELLHKLLQEMLLELLQEMLEKSCTNCM